MDKFPQPEKSSRYKLAEDGQILETTGHLLEVGDRVLMNILAIGEGDLDGIEVTTSGFNYWRYMCQHPDEVYTVTGFDFSEDTEVSYTLSGAMEGNNWFSNELILLPAPKSRFEEIKSMTFQEMAQNLIPMIVYDLCEDGVPGPEAVEKWLSESMSPQSTGQSTT